MSDRHTLEEIEKGSGSEHKRSWTLLIVAGIIFQVALSAYVIWSTVGQKPEPLTHAPWQKSEPGVRKRTAPVDPQHDTMAMVYKNLLLKEINVNAAEWQVQPEFFENLLQRKEKDLADFEANKAADDRVIGFLKGYPLVRLVINNTHVTGASVEIIGTMTGLQYLEMNDIKLTNSQLKKIAALPELTRLCLSGSGLDDESMRILSKSKVKQLIIDRNEQITDKGVGYLTSMPLVQLSLGAASITDKGVAQLAKINSLKQLSIWRTKVTDNCFKDIAKLTNLRGLLISDTAITDEGLKDLKLPHLELLEARGCPGLTKKGLDTM